MFERIFYQRKYLRFVLKCHQQLSDLRYCHPLHPLRIGVQQHPRNLRQRSLQCRRHLLRSLPFDLQLNLRSLHSRLYTDQQPLHGRQLRQLLHFRLNFRKLRVSAKHIRVYLDLRSLQREVHQLHSQRLLLLRPGILPRRF